MKDRLNIIFCGTAVGNKSFEKGHYYAHHSNKFWSILYKSKLTPIQLNPSDYKKVLKYGIGLTDLVKEEKGNDSDLNKEHYDINRLNNIIHKYQPKWLCFNGKEAAKKFFKRNNIHYGIQSEQIGSTKIFVAPSTSGRASQHWNENYWLELAKLIKK